MTPKPTVGQVCLNCHLYFFNSKWEKPLLLHFFFSHLCRRKLQEVLNITIKHTKIRSIHLFLLLRIKKNPSLKKKNHLLSSENNRHDLVPLYNRVYCLTFFQIPNLINFKFSKGKQKCFEKAT